MTDFATDAAWRQGRLHLSAVAKLAPHLRDDNAEALLARAAHRSKREIELLVAELAPRPDVPSLMRRLPAARAATPRSSRLAPSSVLASNVTLRCAAHNAHQADLDFGAAFMAAHRREGRGAAHTP